MKLHFEPNLDYQLQAIDAVCDLFRGQEICRSEFTVTMQAPLAANVGGKEGMLTAKSDLGIGNRLSLLDDELLQNLHDVQMRNALPASATLASGDFTVEMETGTGKTYVYLRTIFELNRRYGFSKFVIVVPSVAIKEGVYKTLQITKEHFKNLYAGVSFDYFLYDSAKPGAVRNFATSANIQIMVATVGAINKKDVNNLYKESEKMGGEKPIDLIRATRPIIIVDEPQSVDGGLEGRGKEALDRMNPLCTLRYSATHADKHHMVFRLDAVDAYERKLVKQIEVASATVEAAHNKPFVRLLKVENKRGRISARIELDRQTQAGVRRSEVTVCDGDDLQQSANGREIYANFRVGEISTAKDNTFMELRYPGGEAFLRPGEAHGDIDPLLLQREMIRRTIKEHFDKELLLHPRGIKVLSLFFIDSVEKYRRYDADGQPHKGIYADIFEEEYRRAAKLPQYQSLFGEIDLQTAAADVHDGYFSIDNKKRWTDTAENNAGNRENAARAYNLIMKKKEELLSLDTPLKFIFSHSALREGWDNPNVFQICALRDIQSERERRQTIGRGLRLCVNQEGERVRSDINILTVIATEDYEQFAENLQKEIEADTGIRFGVVEPHQFAAIAVTTADGKTAPLGTEQSQALWEHLQASTYIDTTGKVQDALRTALKNGSLELPAAFAAQKEQITAILRKVAGRLEVKNADDRRPVPLRKAIYLSEDFRALWERIKHRTTYRVQFDNERLITDCIAALKHAPTVNKARLQWRKADLAIGEAGITATEKTGAATITLEETAIELPDLLTELQNRTQLTRRSIVRILTASGRLEDFRRNPQQFISLSAEAINRRKRLALVDGIKYRKLGDDAYYAQELFEQEELTGYLENMLHGTQKSLYESVVYDSEVERGFANALEKNEAIRLYVKLPGWFKVPTPLDSYNPDWAVLIEEDGAQRLYFVVETKSSLFSDDLRDKENAKIKCGKAHFDALASGNNPAHYEMARSVDDLLVQAAKKQRTD